MASLREGSRRERARVRFRPSPVRGGAHAPAPHRIPRVEQVAAKRQLFGVGGHIHSRQRKQIEVHVAGWPAPGAAQVEFQRPSGKSLGSAGFITSGAGEPAAGAAGPASASNGVDGKYPQANRAALASSVEREFIIAEAAAPLPTNNPPALGNARLHRILRASASPNNVIITMFWLFHPGVRHPLYPSVRATPALSSYGHPTALSERFNSLPTPGCAASNRAARFLYCRMKATLCSPTPSAMSYGSCSRCPSTSFCWMPTTGSALTNVRRIRVCTCRGTSAHIEYRRGWKRRLAAVAAQVRACATPMRHTPVWPWRGEGGG